MTIRKNRVKISCVIPAYNEERNISACLNSLLNQSVNCFEIIVVDDGSTDNTVEIVKEMMKKDSRIRLLKQSHNGPGSARNLGAKNAKGKVIVFPDADEEYPSNYLEKLANPILSGKEIGTIPRQVKLNQKSNHLSKIKAYDHYGRQADSFTSTEKNKPEIFKAIRRDIFIKIGGFDNSNDYFDDSSLFKKMNKRPAIVDTEFYVTHSSSLREIVTDSAWGVKSNLQSGQNAPIIFGFCSAILILLAYFLVFYYHWAILIIIYVIIGLYGYSKTNFLPSIWLYQFYFLFKLIGLYVGIASFFLNPKSKGKPF